MTLEERLSLIERAMDVLNPRWRDRALAPRPGAKDGGGAPGVRESRSEKVIDQLVGLARAYQGEAEVRGERLSYRDAVQRVLAMPEHEALCRKVRALVARE